MPELTFDELADRLADLAELTAKFASVVVADAETARYARVLEYGSIAGQPPWPNPGARTVLTVDPKTGAQVVVSAQAPQGFVRVRVPQFLDELRAQLAGPVDWLDAAAVENHLRQAVDRATQAALEELRSAAPRDSGRFAESLAVAAE